MQLEVGDKVQFLNEVGGGVITKVLNSHKVLVETPDGFEYTYPINQLVKTIMNEKGLEFH